jgi:methyl-accepting chemotaxis protein
VAIRRRGFDVRGLVSRALSAIDEALDRGWAALAGGRRFSGILDLLSQGIDRDRLPRVVAAIASWRPDLRIRGIKGRLFGAFAAVTGMTVIAAIAASLLFSHVGSLLQGVAAKNIPEVIATLELARETQSLAAGAPGPLAAANQEQRERQLKALQDVQGRVRQRLDALAILDSGRHSIEHLLQLNAALNDKLAGLDGLVDAGIDLRQSGAEAERDIDATHARLREILNPAIATAEAAINIITTTADTGGADSGADAGTGDPSETPLALIHRHMLLVQKLTDLAGKVDTASGLLFRAARAPDTETVDALRQEFAGLGEPIAHQIAIVETLEPALSLQAAAASLLAQGRDGTTLFDTRRNELEAGQQAKKILAEASGIIAELSAEVSREVDAVRQATEAATGRSNAAVGFGTLVMLAIAAISVVGAFLFIWLYIGRNLVARLVGVERSMTRLAGGELSVAITGTQRGDEIGRMAQALEVFRDGLVRADALAADQARERDEKQRRAVAVEEMISGFDTTSGMALAAVADAVAELQGSAERMASTTKRAAVQADEVATASTQAAANVETVAAATEELSSSVGEIGSQVAESTRIAGQAVEEVSRSQATVTELSQAAQKIGDVVKLISDIARQTNLLALNATIEAARAGEAGRGFAVVASEVKILAKQTAEATQAITAQVAAIQNSTGQAVGTIKSIGEIIDRIAAIATGVAAAVEQQGASTQEIARNIQQASAGSQQVSSHIASVTGISAESGAAADSVLTATARLTREADMLRGEVGRFLTQIRAA